MSKSNIDRIKELYKEGKIKDKTLVKMASFQDELEKLAISSKIKPYLGGAVGAAGLFLAKEMMDQGARLAHKGIRKITNTDQKNFNKMLEANPKLKDYHRENPDEVEKYFSSLTHFAPTVADEPMAAGSFVMQSIREGSGIGGPPFGSISNLAKTEKDITSAREKSYRYPSAKDTDEAVKRFRKIREEMN